MAAVEQTELVTITINDTEIQVPKGELIVESVKRLGLEIPIFCYHPRMKPVGMCRMCLVEVGFKQPDGSVRKMPKPQAGCTLPADNNMVVYTDTEMVHRDRKGVLEFLLINHPLDCPICDRGGECPLQNNTLFYGPSTSRFTELKRHAPKAYPLSDYVTLDLERCIQCGRCVRFTEEISGDAQLAFRFRGADMQPSTFQLLDFESKFSGNVIEICPVGALTSSKYRFRARPWDLETHPAICTLCSNGCNVWFDHRGPKFVRINGRTNEAVNEEWTCDRGKFGHDFYNSERRLTRPMMRKGDEFVAVSWGEAYEAIAAAFSAGGNKVAGLVGGSVSNEGLYLFQRMFREVFHSHNIDHRWTANLRSREQRAAIPSVETKIADFEMKSNILIFDSSLADEQPMIFLRVRKAWFQNEAKVVVVTELPTDADQFASAVLRYRPGSQLAAARVLRAAMSGAAPSVEDLRETGLDVSSVRAAVDLLGSDGSVVTSRTLDRSLDSHAVLTELLAGARAKGMEFNNYVTGANDLGAELLGVLPDAVTGGGAIQGDSGFGTHEILDAAASARLSALWLVDCDPLRQSLNRREAQAALETVDFLVYQGSMDSDAVNYASVILPMAAPAEQDGTYTNVEGRVQRMRQVVAAQGDAKQAWRIFSELMLRTTPTRPFFNPGEVMDEIAATVPALAHATYAQLGDEGLLAGKAATADTVSDMN
jgi:NADH-quinone oxidoreductase subunit G